MNTVSENTSKRKISVIETGHAKNVANFQELITFVTAYGTAYNPSKESLKLPQLNALKIAAETQLLDVIAKNTAYNNAVNERINAFSGLRIYATRLLNALQTTNATNETIGNAKSFNRKMQGKKAGTSQIENNLENPAPKTISSSQQSYDQLIQHLAGLKSILETETSYTPNETDLQVASIQAKIVDLQLKNTTVVAAYTTISNARIARNEILYNANESLVETAKDIKQYIKSVYGASSPQFAQVKGIMFTKPRK
ncbi:hypothetical protein [Flavobacterium sp. J27]|uniref:hypothetical protein n=1 Tax=Flavobacterium sp. J27 TaxID=2060419 RepID=UPI001031B239|nr:hypothetical protein [Flavobacterium sp. J27]